MSTLTPFQHVTVDYAVRHVARCVEEGWSMASTIENVLGRIDYPLGTERRAARAVVVAAYDRAARAASAMPLAA